MDQAGPGSLEVYILQKSGIAKKTCSSDPIEGSCLGRTCKSLWKEERTWRNPPRTQCFRHSLQEKKTGTHTPPTGELAIVLGGLGVRSTFTRMLWCCNTGCPVRYPYLMHCKFMLLFFYSSKWGHNNKLSFLPYNCCKLPCQHIDRIRLIYFFLFFSSTVECISNGSLGGQTYTYSSLMLDK